MPDPADEYADPQSAFEVEWAREVLHHTVECMRQECERTGRDHLWSVFEGRLLRPVLEGAEPVSYQQLAARHRLASASQGSNLLVTANRMFQRCLREVVGQYAADETEVDEEIVKFEEILSRGSAHLS